MKPRSDPPASGHRVDLIGNLPDPALAGTLERILGALPGVRSASLLRISGMQAEYRVVAAADAQHSLDPLKSALERVAFHGMGLVVEGSSTATRNPVIVFSALPLREARRRRARRPRAAVAGDAARDEQASRPRGTPRATPGVPGAQPLGDEVSGSRVVAPATPAPSPSADAAPVALDPASQIRAQMGRPGPSAQRRRTWRGYAPSVKLGLPPKSGAALEWVRLFLVDDGVSLSASDASSPGIRDWYRYPLQLLWGTPDSERPTSAACRKAKRGGERGAAGFGAAMPRAIDTARETLSLRPGTSPKRGNALEQIKAFFVDDEITLSASDASSPGIRDWYRYLLEVPQSDRRLSAADRNAIRDSTRGMFGHGMRVLRAINRALETLIDAGIGQSKSVGPEPRVTGQRAATTTNRTLNVGDQPKDSGDETAP